MYVLDSQLINYHLSHSKCYFYTFFIFPFSLSLPGWICSDMLYNIIL